MCYIITNCSSPHLSLQGPSLQEELHSLPEVQLGPVTLANGVPAEVKKAASEKFRESHIYSTTASLLVR